MPLLHKFQEHDFHNEYQTHNSILDIVPYEPEAIFIGTYNHGWTWNQSDFFYGRGMYMWTVMGNLFLHNHNHLTAPRTFANNIPTLLEVFQICNKGKMVFADIVKGLKDEVIAIENIPEQTVLVNGHYTWTSYKDSPLDYMGNENWLDDNVDAIVAFINRTPSIKHIYFTFKSGVWLVNKMNEICAQVRQNVSFCSIFTPTANGFGALLPHPYDHRAWGLTHCWVWNGLPHAFPINRLGYGHLDHDWLRRNGVNPDNF